MKAGMFAAIYARYSTESQRPESIVDQINSCKVRASQDGMAVREKNLYADKASSGTRKDRRALLDMVEAAKAGEFSAVYVDDLSRLARDNHLMLTLMAEFHYHGVRVVSVADGLDSEDDDANLGIQIRGIFNELQVNDIRKKTLRGMLGQKKRGFSAGERVYGYSSVPVGEFTIDKNGKRRPEGYSFEVNSDKARVVLRVFKDFSKGLSKLSIVKSLNKEGVVGHRGMTGKWSVSTITRMLRNEKYIGKWVWNKAGNRRDPHTGRVRTIAKQETEWVTRVDESLRIVPEDLWSETREKANAVGKVWPKKKGRSFFKGQNSRELLFPSHLLSGLVFCKYCDGAMSLVSGKNGGYFGCLAASKKACSNHKLVQRSIVEERMLQILAKEMSNTESYHNIMKHLVAKVAESQKEIPRLLADKRKELCVRERKLKNYVDFVAEGKGSKTIGDAIVQEERFIETLRQALRQLEVRNVEVPLPSETWVEKRLSSLKSILERRTKESALLLREVIGKIILRYEEEGNPKSLYVANTSFSQGAILLTPLADSNNGSNGVHLRPQGDSNPCCRRERAKS